MRKAPLSGSTWFVEDGAGVTGGELSGPLGRSVRDPLGERAEGLIGGCGGVQANAKQPINSTARRADEICTDAVTAPPYTQSAAEVDDGTAERCIYSHSRVFRLERVISAQTAAHTARDDQYT